LVQAGAGLALSRSLLTEPPGSVAFSEADV
jgi:hypothetical protein